MIRYTLALLLAAGAAFAEPTAPPGRPVAPSIPLLTFSPGDYAGNPTTRMQAAQNAAQAVGGGTIIVRPGALNLAANVYTAGTNTWLFQRGASITGAGQVDAVVDGAVLASSGMTLARLLSSTANEHGMFVSLRLAPTSGTGQYEKSGFIASLIQMDGSNYGTGALKDAVAFEGQGQITGTLTGRIWGINTGVGPGVGADGYAVGGEFGVQSFSGAPAGPLGTPTSKLGVHIVAYGNSTSTAASVISGNGTTWQDGHVIVQEAIDVGGRALSVRPVSTTRAADVAYIGRDGAAQFTALGVSPGGQAVIQSPLTVTAVAALPAGITLDSGGMSVLGRRRRTPRICTERGAPVVGGQLREHARGRHGHRGHDAMIRTITPPAETRLATPADLAAELGVPTDAAWLPGILDVASEEIVGFCGRPFARATVAETFVTRYGPPRQAWGSDDYCLPLILSRTPVATIVSVVQDGVTLDPSAYALDAGSGLLRALFWAWSARSTEVTYAGGYLLPGQNGRDLPFDLERACLDRAITRYHSSGRDRTIKSEMTVGVGSVSYADGTRAGEPAEFAGLKRYREVRL